MHSKWLHNPHNLLCKDSIEIICYGWTMNIYVWTSVVERLCAEVPILLTQTNFGPKHRPRPSSWTCWLLHKHKPEFIMPLFSLQLIAWSLRGQENWRLFLKSQLHYCPVQCPQTLIHYENFSFLSWNCLILKQDWKSFSLQARAKVEN